MVVACTKENSPTEPMAEAPVASFIAIGADLEKVYQFSYSGENASGLLFDLSAELGVGPDYLTLRQAQETLTFYSFANGSFSLRQKNLATGAITVHPDFFANSAGRSLTWGTNNNSRVFFGFFGPDGTRNLGLQDVALNRADSFDTFIDLDIDLAFQPLLFQNKLFISYRDLDGNYKLTVYDTDTRSLGAIRNFQDTPISLLLDDTDQLAVVKNGFDATLATYDVENLTLIDEQPLNFNTAFSAGPVSGAVLFQNQLFYAKPFAQPARFSAGPAVFDLNTQEGFEIDLFSIADAVETELGENIQITSQTYDLTHQIFLIGYGLVGDQTKGGVLQISTTGDLVAHIELNFVPDYFVKQLVMKLKVKTLQ